MAGLALGPSLVAPAPAASASPQPPNLTLAGGLLSAQSLASVREEKRNLADSQATFQQEQAQDGVVGLAGHVRNAWIVAREAKRDVERRMLDALYARRGEYTPEKKAQITEAGQPAIYMMLAATKMRQGEALLRDIFMGSGADKPWTIEPDALAELPPFEVAKIKGEVTAELTQSIEAGLEPDLAAVRQRLTDAKAELLNRLREEAVVRAARMEDKMETQLCDGGFTDALDAFITDLTTFPAAFVAGPLVRTKPRLKWVGTQPVVQDVQVLEWERVDPFDIYPAPWARSVSEGPLIRKHRLTREALTAMRGVQGFSDAAIDQVLDNYGTSGLTSDWLDVDSQKARAEGKLTIGATLMTGLIDALQYWGSVSGKMLREWGMTAKAIPDEGREYQAEVWLIGPYVIKATLNTDPLARRGIYSSSYERIPGTVWGNGVYDLVRDCADMCNASARSLAANLGIASGPQVVVNVSRLPTGESVTQMYPWKIWQVEEDPMGNVAPPITFFQPSSNAAELMGVYEKFSNLADEYAGIPKYTTGVEGTPGAGRTASGLSMMLGNASKIIKQVVGGVDTNVLSPLLERLYYYNMRYADDPDLKGAVNITARGALAITTKDAAQVRRNEFLTATANPIDMQIIGVEGRAELLRSTARTLDLNPDKLVPPASVIRERARIAQMQAAAQGSGTPGSPGTEGSQLANGAPVTNSFAPVAGGSA